VGPRPTIRVNNRHELPMASRSSKVDLARLVDSDGGRDEAEADIYETVADPSFMSLVGQRRRFRGSVRRRIRRLNDRSTKD